MVDEGVGPCRFSSLTCGWPLDSVDARLTQRVVAHRCATPASLGLDAYGERRKVTLLAFPRGSVDAELVPVRGFGPSQRYCTIPSCFKTSVLWLCLITCHFEVLSYSRRTRCSSSDKRSCSSFYRLLRLIVFHHRAMVEPCSPLLPPSSGSTSPTEVPTVSIASRQ
jgi:hypothetical protein